MRVQVRRVLCACLLVFGHSTVSAAVSGLTTTCGCLFGFVCKRKAHVAGEIWQRRGLSALSVRRRFFFVWMVGGSINLALGLLVFFSLSQIWFFKLSNSKIQMHNHKHKSRDKRHHYTPHQPPVGAPSRGFVRMCCFSSASTSTARTWPLRSKEATTRRLVLFVVGDERRWKRAALKYFLG